MPLCNLSSAEQNDPPASSRHPSPCNCSASYTSACGYILSNLSCRGGKGQWTVAFCKATWAQNKISVWEGRLVWKNLLNIQEKSVWRVFKIGWIILSTLSFFLLKWWENIFCPIQAFLIIMDNKGLSSAKSSSLLVFLYITWYGKDLLCSVERKDMLLDIF